MRNLAAALLLALPLAGRAAPGDEAVLGAYDAYRAGDALKLERYAAKLEGHPLDPWIDYWSLAMRLEDAPAAQVQAFLDSHANTYVAELLRSDWLKVLGKRGEWLEFERQLGRYPRDDLEVHCYAALMSATRGQETTLADTMWMWLEPHELPDGCAELAQFLLHDERITVTDVWRRVRMLFERGQITAAKSTLEYLEKRDAPDERMLAEAARQPKRLLERLPRNLERRPVREVVVLALLRYARAEPDAAAKLLDGKLATRLPEADMRYLWAYIGYEGAREQQADALKWYARAGQQPLDEELLAWKVRAALRAGNWPVVRDTIDVMPPLERHETTWTYWYGRALATLGNENGARAYFLRIAGQTEFYGLLASEELGSVVTPPENAYVPTEAEVDAMRQNPGIARALELIRLGMRTEGVREWLFSVRYFDDAKLLAAAELARRAEIWDRAIMSADRTVRTHNFSLRYPLPFRDVFTEYAKTYGLDVSWVLGLVRQESRFISDARSAAGAEGLMQVMPRTARFVARKIGLRNYLHKGVTEVETNVTLGTGYMRLVLDQLGHPVLASAAY
ncbi:MAG TPA: transglycosylase SLT domain-containing protein, partial [Burkholderiales bacterium]|nr:transglycosylase SLT domain-containing protein [Burkholderiales bacterium]